MNTSGEVMIYTPVVVGRDGKRKVSF